MHCAEACGRPGNADTADITPCGRQGLVRVFAWFTAAALCLECLGGSAQQQLQEGNTRDSSHVADIAVLTQLTQFAWEAGWRKLGTQLLLTVMVHCYQ